MSLQDHGIYTNLRGAVCACGKAKDPGKSFCRADYFKLPRELRDRLYQRNGYPETYREALKVLGLEEPAGPKTLSEVFPPRLTSRPMNQIRRKFYR